MLPTTSHPRPRLADHVRACHVGDRLVFLDLRRSKYIGVGGPHLAALSALLAGRSDVDDPQALPANTVLLDRWIGRLRSHQLLADAQMGEPPPSIATLPDAVQGLATEDDAIAATTNWHHLLRLWRSVAVTSRWVRRLSLVEIAERVAALRTGQATLVQGQRSEALRAAVLSYLHLRPFAQTSEDRCLNDSLALLHFLAAQGLFPHWVIGVRARPFAAHSWVQCSEVVLNDFPEHVRQYRPILVV
jgi:hypothetical protein